EWRDLARAAITRFAEVQIDCALDVAQARARTRATGAGPRDVYATAGRPGATVPGVDVPYERALAPELIVDTTVEDARAAAERVAALALSRGPALRPPTAGGGAVLWLTGPPGSGKTTLASQLAERLAGEGAPVTMLEWAALRDLVLGGVPEPEVQ